MCLNQLNSNRYISQSIKQFPGSSTLVGNTGTSTNSSLLGNSSCENALTNLDVVVYYAINTDGYLYIADIVYSHTVRSTVLDLYDSTLNDNTNAYIDITYSIKFEPYQPKQTVTYKSGNPGYVDRALRLSNGTHLVYYPKTISDDNGNCISALNGDYYNSIEFKMNTELHCVLTVSANAETDCL